MIERLTTFGLAFCWFLVFWLLEIPYCAFLSILLGFGSGGFEKSIAWSGRWHFCILVQNSGRAQWVLLEVGLFISVSSSKYFYVLL